MQFETFRQDLRFAVRSLRKSPGFLAVVILSLALGVGANSTIFSVINAALLKPLPYPQPDRLVVIWDTDPAHPQWMQQPPIADLTDWKQQNHVFEDIALTSFTEGETMAGAGEAQAISVQNVTPNYFSILGAKPRLGRIFFREEMQERSQSVVLSDAFWKTKFNADPNVLGKTFSVEGSVSTVVGIMPPGFGALDPSTNLDMWLPIDPQSNRYSQRIDHWLLPIGRLKPNVTMAQAQVEMDVIAQRLAEAYPTTNKGVGEKLNTLSATLRFGFGQYLYPLLGAVAFVLLIGCVNVANLMQSRTEGRRKEYALRSALGADRSRLMQQMLIESGVLAVLGGVLGMLLTFVGIPIFRSLAGEFTVAESIAIDGRVLLFTLAISVVTALLFGMAPALQASRTDPNSALREGERGSVGKSRGRIRQTLAVVEIALAMVLLVGAGLMIGSILRLQEVNPGFDSRDILTAQVELPEGGKYIERVPGGDMEKVAPSVIAFYQQLLQKLAVLPGVESAATASVLPNQSARAFSFSILAHPAPSPDDRPQAGYSDVSADFFRMLRIPLRKGRFLDERDTLSAPWALVVNEAFARKYLPNDDPIGQQVRLRFDPYPVDEERPRQIVGVVGDIKHALGQPPPPCMYASPLQQPAVFPGGTATAHSIQAILIKMQKADKRLEANTFAALRNAVAEVDPSVPILSPMAMSQVLDQSIGGFRLYRNLLEVFAGIALLLAVIGIYGVISYFVSQRIHEIGIRVALGANSDDVLGLIGKLGLKLGAAGVILGALLALALTRLIATFLYGVKPTDPLTYVIVGVGLVGVALLACLVPARRATKVDPMIALRHE
jgi:putative ABC transport system permease protein